MLDSWNQGLPPNEPRPRRRASSVALERAAPPPTTTDEELRFKMLGVAALALVALVARFGLLGA